MCPMGLCGLFLSLLKIALRLQIYSDLIKFKGTGDLAQSPMAALAPLAAERQWGPDRRFTGSRPLGWARGCSSGPFARCGFEAQI